MKLPKKLATIASPVRRALRSQFHTLWYRARQRRGWTFATTACFCLVFDEIRAFLRPQSHRNQPVTLAQRRAIHQDRFAQLMGMIAAA
jgi:hypothetical protein